MSRAVSVDPVNATPAMRGSPVSTGPMREPRPGTKCSTSPGIPDACSRRTISAATIGVCSAGFAITLLPAASAALTWPVKMASGKFQGLMQANTPRPRNASRFDSPVGPGSASGLPKSASARAA
jgi:hypothetical protein